MNESVIQKIIEKGYKISFAESATGGALASEFTKVPGASNVFKGSFITYSDEYKIKYLSVSVDTIKRYGVVSSNVALEMVRGLKKETNADILISVTGNAGPSKGDLNEPVGRVYIGMIFFDKEEVFELNLNGNRKEVIEATVDFVYSTLDSLL